MKSESASRGRISETGSDDVTRVHTDRARLLSEVLRMKAASEIARRTGILRVPEVRAVSDTTLTVTIERVHSYLPLANVLERRSDRSEVIRGVGEALYAIHGGRWVDAEGRPSALFHGDPDPFNVGVDADGRPVFIDWDPAPGLKDCDLDPQETDAGLLVFYLTALCVRRRRGVAECADFLRLLSDGYGVDQRSRDWLCACGLAVGRVLSRMDSIPTGPWLQRRFRWVVRREALRILTRVRSTF